jgi:hypothetical protein
VCGIGLYFAYIVNALIGIIIMVVGCISLFLYSNSMDKVRKVIVKRLKQDWREGLDNNEAGE